MASLRLRIEGIERDRVGEAVDAVNGSQTAPGVFNEQYALATAPRTK
jgi:hypothetical protein